MRALCCRGENGFSPDPVSALGLFEVTMCFSSPVQRSPGRLQKECSIWGQQQFLSPVQGSKLRSLSRQGCGSRGLAGNRHGETERGERCIQGPHQPSGDKTLGFKMPRPKGARMSAGLLYPSPRGCGWAGSGTCCLAPAPSRLSGRGTLFKVGVSHELPHGTPCVLFLCAALSQLRL